MALTLDQQTDAYRFFAIAFGAAPGVTNMNDIAKAYEGGANTKQIVNTYTSKSVFTDVYPLFLTNEQFATRLVNNVVGSSATDAAKAKATSDIAAALNAGATRGDVVFAVFNNIAKKTTTASDYADFAALQTKLANQVAVAKYYTEEKLGNGDASALKAVLAQVTENTDVSSAEKLEAIITNAVPPAPQSFQLSVNADTATGGAGADSFVAVTNAHLQSFDSINGGAGNDAVVMAENFANANAANAAVVDNQFTSARSIEVLRVTGINTDAGSNKQSVTLGANAATAGISSVALEGTAKTLDITGFNGALAVTGTSGADDVSVNLTATGAKTLTLGAGGDTLTVTPVTGAKAGSVQVNFTSGSVGNGTVDFATIVSANGNVKVDDEGVTITNPGAAGSKLFNVVGLAADGTVDTATQNRGNFDTVILGTSAAETPSVGGDGKSYYVNSGGGADTMTGSGAGDHFLVGGSGNDVINVTGSGVTSVIAGAGNDVVNVTGSNVVNNIQLGDGDDTVVFASGLSGGQSADVVAGGAGTDTLEAPAAELAGQSTSSSFGYATPAVAVISGFEAFTLSTAMAGNNNYLAPASIQAGIATVTLAADGNNGATVAFEAGARTVNLGKAGSAAGTLVGSLTVSAAGTANTDALTVNVNNTAAVNALGGNNLDASGFESVTINLAATNNGATPPVAVAAPQSLGTVTLGGSAKANTDALTLTPAGSNALAIAAVNATTDGVLTINASGITAKAATSGLGNGYALYVGATTADAAATGTAPVRSGTFVDNGVTYNTYDLAEIIKFYGSGALNLTGTAEADFVTGTTSVAVTADLTIGKDSNNNNSGGVGAGKYYVTGTTSLNTVTNNTPKSNATDVGIFSGNDTISTGAGNDVINASTGNNSIDSGEGADSVVAGTGNDTILAGAGNDTITSTGGNDSVTAGDGADQVSLGAGNDFIDGGAGNDFLNAGAGNNTVVGDVGNDTVFAGAGNDSIDAGAGDDNIDAGNGNNTVAAGDGNDTVVAGAGNDSIDGGAGNDNIDGSNGNNALNGGDGVDTINAGAGNDTIDGGAGNDIVGSGDGNNVVNGGDGADNITAGVGNDLINAGAGDDTIASSNGADTVNGGDGNDTINLSGTGGDVVTGGAGNDTINVSGNGDDDVSGGAGVDVINLLGSNGFSGNGADTIRFAAGDTGTAAGNSGAAYATAQSVATLDRVTGFGNDNNNTNTQVDKLVLPFAPTGVGSTASGTVIALVYGVYDSVANTFQATAPGTPVANQATLVMYDADGAGAGTAVEAVVLVGSNLGSTGATGGQVIGG